ncbi:MerR family transcriptional regulator [Paenibacillus sp.]|uniref:MerR family transcriptional regulator n=1 Tax=Paenibacillus sp. TaxID=58172 RepID=UPI002D29E694|nr:MerR family transcriptional regulator [Paenibacillus sp.]HZG57190.1 MerR family transcriptional regulator [Paenibacillus sp.]
MTTRPIDIARKLCISTSALRHYEAWGIVPAIERSSNGYRVYTDEHVAYFECIRAMGPGFGMKLTSEVLRKIQQKDVNSALWLVNEAQVSLHREKFIAEKTIQLLESKELDNLDKGKERKEMTIGEVSAETEIPSSAIRYWEKTGLIKLTRDENGYRTFTNSHVRQILLIRTLRTANYPLETVLHILKELDQNNVEQARKIARNSLENLHMKNHDQLRGMHYLYNLCRKVNLLC